MDEHAFLLSISKCSDYRSISILNKVQHAGTFRTHTASYCAQTSQHFCFKVLSDPWVFAEEADDD